MINAPDFPSHLTWLNTAEPLSLKQLRGYVVLLDFWTYCCINCIHILLDLKAIEEQFAGQPVVVIGVHAAKFANEQSTDNIQSAIERYQIQHPVVVDNDHEVWDEYAVRAWPSFVLIDAEGKVRGQVSGEGHRERLTEAIKQLLDEGKQKNILVKSPRSFLQPITEKSSTLQFPGKICFDDTGKKLFISDSNHHRILVTELSSPTAAKIANVIGAGTMGSKDGDWSTAQFNQPQGLCFSGNHLYVCDTENHLLRDIDMEKETVTTLAGTGDQAEFGSGGGQALQTALSSPWDVTYTDQYLYIAMAGNHQIWRYDFNTQEVIAWVGSGAENIVDGPATQAQLAQPSGISLANNTLYFADSEVSAVRALNLDEKVVKTVVGHGLFVFGHQDGEFEDALLQHPLGVHAAEDKVYVADTYNHAVRLLDLTNQKVSTLIKRENKDSCMLGDVSCQILPLFEPNDVKKQGQLLYIADTNNHLIRVFDLEKNTLTDLTLTTPDK